MAAIMNRRRFVRSAAACGLWLPTVQAQLIYLPRRRPASAAAAAAYTYYSSYFDGTNDYADTASALSGAADNKLLTISFWLKGDSLANATRYDVFQLANSYVSVRRNTSNKFQVYAFNAAATTLVNMESSSNVWNGTGAVTGWIHFLFSVDTSDTGKRHLYINGNSDLGTVTTHTDGNIDWNRAVNTLLAGTAGINKWKGWVSELYVTSEYIDFSSSANRALFRTSGGKPENLGTDGSTPTGTAALVYLANEYSTFQTNKGSGGGFTEQGEITDGGADIP